MIFRLLFLRYVAQSASASRAAVGKCAGVRHDQLIGGKTGIAGEDGEFED
jgi:hypothetical protein